MLLDILKLWLDFNCARESCRKKIPEREQERNLEREREAVFDF